MKKPSVVSVITALMLLMEGSFAQTQTQNPADEEKPTFYRLVPGTYVNGWPRFTVTYPKDWVEVQPGFTEAFRAVAPGPVPEGRFIVYIFTNPLPLEKFADLTIRGFRNIAQDVTLVGDKPSQLRDGTLAREVEIKTVINGEPRNILSVATKKSDIWIETMVVSGPSAKIGEDLRAIPIPLSLSRTRTSR